VGEVRTDETSKKSRAQKTFSRLVSPAGAARMEAESRTWIVHCPKCGYERSVWDIGGVIYKGAGTRYWFMKCPNCSQRSWNKVYWPAGVKKSDVYAAALQASATDSAATPALSERRPWLMWVLAAIVWLGLITGAVFLFGFLLLNLVINPLTQPFATAGDTFMTAVKAGNYQQAYNLCTPDLQKEVGSVSGLEQKVRGNQPAQWNWSNRSNRDGVGYLDGPLTYTDGRKGSGHLTLTQVAGEWKISSFRFSS
jgi:hypothetical protein